MWEGREMASWTLLILIVASIVYTWIQAQFSDGVVYLLSQRPSTSVGIASFIATAIGVVLSCLAFKKGFNPSVANIAGAIGVAIVACLGTYALKRDKTRFDPQDFLTFVKDGFLWTSAYPALAVALGEIGKPTT
jgi:hypothetical protein